MFRAVFAAVFTIASAGLLGAGLYVGTDSPSGEVLTNLGTEVFGILVTIALVDWFLEKRRRQDRAKELAWSILHEIEHSLWVWQGGPRHMGTDDLLGLVSGIDPSDQMEPFTEALVQNIGTHSRGIHRREGHAVRSVPGLGDVLHDLTALVNMKENPPSTMITAVKEILADSIRRLGTLLGQPTERMPSGLIWYRDPSPEGQEKRYRQVSPGFERGYEPPG